MIMKEHGMNGFGNPLSQPDQSDKFGRLKTEFAEETGIDISQYNTLDKGGLTSRQTDTWAAISAGT